MLYIEKCKELNLNYIGWYYSGHDSCIQYTCNKHLDKGVLHSAWTHLKIAKYGCKYCIGRGRTTDEIKYMLKDKPYQIISEYTGVDNPITCQCNICEHIWTTIPRGLFQGTSCPICSVKKRGINSRMSHDEFLKRINPDIEILSQYQGLKVPVQCRCKNCHHEWQSKPDNLIHEHINCPFCSRSKMEIRLGQVLECLNLGEVKSHVRLKGCKLFHTLEFDYIVYKHNKILFACEYDGEQHYFPIDYAGKGEIHAQQSYQKTKQRDEAKNQYCLQHQIPLIRIPYWEKDNMESFLLSQYKEICKETVETAG